MLWCYELGLSTVQNLLPRTAMETGLVQFLEYPDARIARQCSPKMMRMARQSGNKNLLEI